MSQTSEDLSALQRALLSLREMRAKLQALENAKNDSIAIIGMSCRFPSDVETPEEFWDMLCNGIDAVREVPKERWDIDAYYDPHPEVPGKMYTRYGSFLSQVDQFDPLFFGISPREAISMDPQQRLLLELSWEALERAGYAPTKLPIQTGVFIGMSENDYMTLPMPKDTPVTVYDGSGNDLCFASGRLSYILGIQGPNLALDTACSSSSVAIHLAVQSLHNDECELALAGGVHLNLSPETTVLLSQSGALSPDGRCKTFDASADGYGRGEGGGIFILKRLSKAVADGDNILAIIRGTATNHDGRSSGLTVPNKIAQESLIRQALKNAQVEPNKVSFVEAHGTGTSLGDPIEIRALDAVFGKERINPLMVGSVKTNIGHLEGASGVASLMKVILALQHGEIPANLHFKQPNPHINWDMFYLTVPTKRTSWSAENQLAGMSSFGLSGTNVHMVIEAAPNVDKDNVQSPERPLNLLTLSAKTKKALVDLAKLYTEHLATNPSLPNVCFTANTGRAHFEHRLSIVADSNTDLINHLSAFSQGVETAVSVPSDERPKIAFLFTGQGAQYVNMGRQLYETQPSFRKTLNHCSEILQAYLDQPLFDVLFPTAQNNQSLINQTAYAQPALFALEYALAELWKSWGIEPSIVMGHSVGEYLAACVAGVFSLEDGLKLIAERGRLMQSLPQDGEMVAVHANEAQVRSAIQTYDTVSIAALNGPLNVVISGEREAIQKIVTKLDAEGFKTKKLVVSHAFHSQLMRPILAEFEQIAKQVSYASPKIGLISNLTGELNNADVATADYWCQHVLQPVRFADGMATLQQRNVDIFVEIGPQPILLGMGRQCFPDDNRLWLPSLRQVDDDWQQMLSSLKTLYLQGVDVDWFGFDRDYARSRVVLPTYPFQRERYWLRQTPSADLFEGKQDWLYKVIWQYQELDMPAISSEEAGSWLIFTDKDGVGEQLANKLKAQGQFCSLIANDGSNSLQHVLSEPLAYKGIIYLWAVDELQNSEKYETAQFHCVKILHLLHAMNKVGKSSHLWLVTRGSQAVEGYEAVLGVEQAPLWGLAQTIMLEYPELQCVCTDLPAVAHQMDEAQVLFNQILSNDNEDQVAFRQSKRYVARLVREPVNNVQATQQIIQSNNSYLITGGLGGIGLQIAHHLVEQGAQYLTLTSRKGAVSPVAQKAVRELEQMGAKILVIKADVANPEDMAMALVQTRAVAPLRGVIHAAGIVDDGILLQQSEKRFERVMLPKIQGGWNLHILTQDDKLDFFVLFSSIASLFGSSGQGNYAAANAFLDALAHYRHGLGLPALSINWGPWAKVGMAARLGTKAEINNEGMNFINPKQGSAIFTDLLNVQPTVQITVMPVDLPKFQEHFSQSLLCSRLVPQKSTDQLVETFEKKFVERIATLSVEEAWECMITEIGQVVIETLRLGSSHNFDPKQRLFELGMDSLMAIELRSRLQSILGQPLSATVVFDYPSVDELARYVSEEILCLKNTQVSMDNDIYLKEIDDLEKLSEDELEALLIEKIATFD